MTDKQVRMVPIDCQCNRCAQEAVRADEGGPFDPRLFRMFCCVQCGNKRCPHATDHRLACTGSNEVGQEGSRYGPPLKSAAAPSVQPDGWQDISTAPKDGTWVVGFIPNAPSEVTPICWEAGPDDFGKSGWCGAGSGYGGVLYEVHNTLDTQPTHWRPLPAPPAALTVQKEEG